MPRNTTKLRIGFVIDDGLDKPDGVQQYVLTLGSWLKDQGHHVRYLAGQTTRNDLKEAISLSRNLTVSFNGNKLSSPLPASSSNIRKVLGREKLDVIHVQMPYSPFMAARVIRNVSDATGVVGTFHIMPLGRLQHLGTKLLGYWLKPNLRRFDKFISVSVPARRFAEQSFGIRSEVISNPVNIKKYAVARKRTKKSGTLNIVFLGRLVPRKGCILLLKAINLLKDREDLPGFKVHICGRGPQQDKLTDYVRNNGLEDLVDFHGFVSEEEKISYLASADLAVFPSTGGESFGIVLTEAMAAKAGVVLAGSNPGYASVMGSLDECLFDPKDTAELAVKISRLLKDDEKRASLHESQQQLVKKFDVELVGRQLLDIYLGLSQNVNK